MQDPHRLAFGSFLLDLHDERLWRGHNVIRLKPKALAVLRCLLTHTGQLVTKEVLFATVWPDTIVSDSVLSAAIRELRRALDDPARHPHYIETVHGRGYRFIAAVEPLTQESRGASSPTVPPVDDTPRSCPSCQHVNAMDASFCNTCGTPLEGAPAHATTPDPPAAAISAETGDVLAADTLPLHEAERRQLTVMFCDLVASTPLAERLDPEDLREVIRHYQATCAAVIDRFEGYIAQYLGDGLLVYFGYPHAHEDDAQRAVHAGLGILEAVTSLNDRLEQTYGVRLAVRIGIHTGLVVVGGLGHHGRREQLALGVTPNIAARLQGLASPNTLVVSAATHQLVQGYFGVEDLGRHTLSGVSTEVQVWRVLRERGVRSRLEATSTHALTAFVGRDPEMTLLTDRWTSVQAGRGQVVVVSGEAGLGKSRLVQVFKDDMARGDYTNIECQTSPYAQHSPLYPVVDYLERRLAWDAQDAPETKLDKLEAMLAAFRLPLHETLPLFASLLSFVPPEDRYSPLLLTPERQRHKLFEALVSNVLEQAERQPVLFILEDIHWSDPSTLELLGLLMVQVPATSIMMLLTCRPEFDLAWGLRSHLTPITLQRLPPVQIEHIIHRVTGGKALPAELIEQLVDKTDGIPLFIEEMTKAVLESGQLHELNGQYRFAGPTVAVTIPMSLQDSLMARLDRLTTAKGIAQMGAAIGRQFSYGLLQAVWPGDEDTLQQELARLVASDLIYQRGVPPQSNYVFKHALIRDAAYESLLRSTRQGHHRRIAEALEERFPEAAETQPELLAYHYTEAGLHEQAVMHWYQAGQQAVERSANREALAHLSKGLEVLKALPDGLERSQRELGCLMLLGLALMATKGQASKEVEETYTRAHVLCHQLGETSQLFVALWGLLSFNVVRAELQSAWDVGRQLLDLAQHQGGTARLMVAHWALGQTSMFLGDFVLARTHLEQGLSLYNSQHHDSLALLPGFPGDLGVFCLCFVSHTLWHLGYPEQALKRIQDALTLAQNLAHPYSRALALDYAAMLYQFRRTSQMVRESSEMAMTFCIEHGFVYYLAWGTIMHGWALTTQGQAEEGLTQMRHGFTDIGATGANLRQPYYLTLMAEAHAQAGQHEAGLTLLAEALADVSKYKECWREADLHRLHGELLLQQSSNNITEAATSFQRAITIAQHQSSKSLELRAATSLSRLWRQEGQPHKAYELLAPVYEWFTEGFDTADLIEAKQLLNELSAEISSQTA